jgi:hypothetical protein
MRSILITVLCTLSAGVAPSQQKSVKPAVQPAGLGKAEAADNEDLNIRAYIELLRTDVRKQMTEIVGQVMRLDADQAAKFWPIYREYEKERAVIGDQIIGLLKNYSDHYTEMTNAVADQLANQLLSIEQQRNSLKKKYYERVKTDLDAITAARFLQVENQLEKLVDLQMAAQLPTIGVEEATQ